MEKRTCLVVLSLVLLLFLTSTISASREHRTEFVCEGNLLNISCPPNQLVRFVRANYGRFSRHICAGNDSRLWSVQCLSPRTLRDLQHGCGVTRHCVLSVTSGRFGDFCVNTPKYLEVHFYCVSEAFMTSTTRRPTPPWFSPVLKRRSHPSLPPRVRPSPPPPPSSTGQELTLRGNLSVPGADSFPDAALPLHLPLSADFTRNDVIDDVTVPDQHFLSDVTNVPVIATSEQTHLQPRNAAHRAYFDAPTGPNVPIRAPSINSADVSLVISRCVASESHGLWWNTTAGGDWFRQPCPSPSVGVAVRKCHGSLGWLRPDLSQCRSVQLMQLQQQLLQDEDAVMVASRLTSLLSQSEITADSVRTSHTQAIGAGTEGSESGSGTEGSENGALYHGGDISLLLRIINQLCSHLSRQLVITAADTQTRAASVKLVTAAAWSTLHWLLDADNNRSGLMWRELNTQSAPVLVHHTLSELLIVHEQVAFLAADYTHVPRLTSAPHRAVNTLAVNVVKLAMTKLDRFIELTPGGTTFAEPQNTIRLSRTALSEHANNNSLTLVVSTLPSIGSLLNLGGAVSHTVVSDVVSVSLGVGRRVALSDPIRLTLRHQSADVDADQAVCVFWDLATSSWSRDGCRRLSQQRRDGLTASIIHTQCECDHLTSFALVIATISDVPIEMEQSLDSAVSPSDSPLECGNDDYRVSYRLWMYLCGCLAVLLLLPVLVCGSRLAASRRNTRRHLALCLSLSHVGTMIGVAVGPGSSHNPILCSLAAALLHLWQLAAAMWQLCEAIQLYILVTTAVGLTERRRICFWPFSYGIPLVIVALCGSLNMQAYGTEQHCWLSTEQYFVFSFVTPASIAIASSLCLYGLSYYIWRQSRNNAPFNTSSAPHKQSRLTSVGRCLRHGVSLVLLTGSTWCQFLILQERPSSTLQTTYSLSSLAVAVCLLVQQRCVPTLCLIKLNRQKNQQKLHSPSASCRTLNTVVNSANCRTVRRSEDVVNSTPIATSGVSDREMNGNHASIRMNTPASDRGKSASYSRNDILTISQVNTGPQYDTTNDKERYVCNTALSPGPTTSVPDGSQYVNAAPLSNLYGPTAPSGDTLTNCESADYVPPYYLTVATNNGGLPVSVSHYSSTYGTSMGSVPAPVPRCGTRVYSSRRPCRQPVVYEEMRRVWHAPNPVIASADSDLYWRSGRISNC